MTIQFDPPLIVGHLDRALAGYLEEIERSAHLAVED
jgi:hypothetical protein